MLVMVLAVCSKTVGLFIISCTNSVIYIIPFSGMEISTHWYICFEGWNRIFIRKLIEMEIIWKSKWIDSRCPKWIIDIRKVDQFDNLQFNDYFPWIIYHPIVTVFSFWRSKESKINRVLMRVDLLDFLYSSV